MPSLVDVIIPHYKGRDKFLSCLTSLFETEYDDFRVILVDNCSLDGSAAEAERLYPQMKVIRMEKNRGFAGGCNAGVEISDREFIALLNDDTEVEPDWLTKLIDVIESDEKIAVVQPKLRWMIDKSKFEYAGAMGGMMDIFGFPFCHGRMFETSEVDNGQYDWVDDIFWASGSACLFRRQLYIDAGKLDEKFFAHQEEIDLNWRLQLMGYRVKAVPQALVYHYAGTTLPPENFMKKYMNHRNSIMLLLKNYQLRTLFWVLPIRIFLELAAVVLAVKQRDYKRIVAIFRGGLWNMTNLPHMLKARKFVKRIRKIPDQVILDRLYKGSIALQYYLFGKRTYLQLFPVDKKEVKGEIK